MTPEDVCHLLAVWWAIDSSVDYFGRLAEVFGAHDRWADNDELLHILGAIIQWFFEVLLQKEYSKPPKDFVLKH